ncbi:MAG: caspase family protein [Bacteroidetes bacterium]|nr:caspase family protein [Bacteroidota bacterium]
MKYILLLLLMGHMLVLKAGINRPKPASIYVISIGINKYQSPWHELNNCSADSKALVEKIIQDNPCPTQQELLDFMNNKDRKYANTVITDSVFSYLLNDEDATLLAIKSAFKEVIKAATSNDYFIFYFAGYTVEVSASETFLLPFSTASFAMENISSVNALSLAELSGLMEQVQCEDQLIISEAGNGKSFAQNLISELFESNPLVAASTARNRVIITTKSFGIDTYKCDGQSIEHGPLTYFILENGNLLNIFQNIDFYEFNLVSTEVKCKGVMGTKYIAIYQEQEYRAVLLNNFKKTNLRGAGVIAESVKPVKKEVNEIITYALIVATNEYGKHSGWGNLKNPENDALAVAAILDKKYNVEVQILIDKPKDSILFEVLKIKNNMDENDNFIFFIAGHGYFSPDFSDGFLVFSSSKALEENLTLESYLQMASLNRMLNNMPSKNVFAIFDVCFGASFDLNAQDLSLSDYNEMDSDISLNELIARKNQYTSRIFLASGKYSVPDYWGNSLSHSPFASKLIQALQKEDVFTSPGKIFPFLERNATEAYLKQFGKHEARGDFILKVNN